ncbi:hypothetical protein KP509_05G082200 [Ceratopteris richardii]|uniref:Uncharacterized protein n=1 Tax=Ceratopteris richardii TaxID=49495 RepID=A0A8T2USA9_CERRI|nr:hypothetical protein KP509_05G082200 [Ceratopteris richardii]
MVFRATQQPASIGRIAAALLACGLALYLLNPHSYWNIITESARSTFSRDCAACVCDCLLDSESMLLPGYESLIPSDCEKLQESSDTRSVDSLTEELRLHETTAEESRRRADAALLEAKKVASQYQKEAEKCSSGMETCEEARERSDAALSAQKKISAMWERRARQLGWRDKHQGLFERFGLSGTTSEERRDSFLFRRA